MEHRQISVRILETHILKLDLSLDPLRQLHSIRFIHNLRLRVINLHHLIRGSGKSLELVHNIAQLAHGVCYGPDQTGKGHKLTHGNLIVYDEKSSHHQQHQRHQVGKGFHIGVVGQPGHGRPSVRLGILRVALVKFGNLIVFSGKSLHHPVSGNIFLSRRVHLRQLFPQRLMPGGNLVLKQNDNQENKGRYGQQGKRKPPVHKSKRW